MNGECIICKESKWISKSGNLLFFASLAWTHTEGAHTHIHKEGKRLLMPVSLVSIFFRLYI